MDVWKPQKIELDRCFQVQIGPLRLWIKRAGDELLMAVENLPESKAQIQAPILAPVDQEEGLRWSRWTIGESEVIQLIPVMPDRPVVVRPEVPVKIPTDKEALFFVSIPIWVRVTAGPEQAILCEQPSLILSNIWFGDLMSGELCYSLRSRARRRITDSEPLLNRATCPVQIRNAAPTQAGRAAKKRFTAQTSMLIRKAIFYFGSILIIMTVLYQMEFKLTAILGAAGIAGIAIGFASQTSISNIISGLFLISEKPFAVGDLIQIRDTKGIVLSIDLLSAKLRTFDNQYIRIPNETLIKNQVTNVTLFPVRRLDIKLGIAYKEDLSKVREVLLDIGEKRPVFPG